MGEIKEIVPPNPFGLGFTVAWGCRACASRNSVLHNPCFGWAISVALALAVAAAVAVIVVVRRRLCRLDDSVIVRRKIGG